jgi:hypothetical protein
MGCFSFKCKECGKPILSNSFRGQKVKLFLLKDSKVIEKMEGEYDSYGRVFTKSLKKSKMWKLSWDSVCELMFDNNLTNGIAAIHSKCFVELPTRRSEDDPDQGWGKDGELMGDTDSDKEF